MALCPYCDAELPEDVVFCLQCGVRVKEVAPAIVPETKVPEGPPAAICRFCKGPLNLRAEFCEQCGAPLEDAAPPGLIQRKAQGALPVEAPPTPAPVPPVPLKAAPQPPKATPPIAASAPPSVGAPVTSRERAAAPAAPPKPGPSAAAAATARPPVTVPPPIVLPQPPKAAPHAEARPAAAGVVSPAEPERTPPPEPTPSVPSAPAPAPRVSVPPEMPKVAARPVPAAPTVEPMPPPPLAYKASAVAPPPPEIPPAEPAAVELAAPLPPEGVAVPKRPFPVVAVIVGIALIVGVGGGAAWFLLRPKPQSEQPTPQAAVPTPPPTVTAQPPRAVTPPPAGAQLPAKVTPAPSEAQPAAAAVSAPSQPKRARVAKPEPAPAPPPSAPAPDPRPAEIANLQNLAREAYARGAYVEPLDSSALNYAKRVLALAPNDDYAKTLLEHSVSGGKYQAQQALQAKDFAAAHRVANALARLLPGRSDIKELQNDIDVAEKAAEAARRPPPAAPILSFRAYHMHSDKAPADKGPYCLGTLSVLGGRIRFVGESASDGQVHNLQWACSEAREIKKNSRVAARQGGFHIRTTSSNTNFAPEDSSPARAAALAAACTK